MYPSCFLWLFELLEGMVRFQYFSDVHTEFYEQNPEIIDGFNIQCEAPYLILAGDIGDPFSDVYTRFLTRLSNMFERVFIVAGNHEYYFHPTNLAYQQRLSQFIQSTAPSAHEWMELINDRISCVVNTFPNISFLNDTYYEIADTDIVIFGATFWTDILPNEQEQVFAQINDYTMIPGLTLSKVNGMHTTSRAALRDLLQGPIVNAHSYVKKLVVVSHHLPSYKLISPKYKDSNINSAYATDIPESQSDAIVAWIAGHTHCPIECGKFHVNPIGYKGELQNTTFCRVIDV